ncbi:hypothetical protein V6N12_034428 [Hibiscus sabdariffa]|uniref:Uncharacterized protein n=1 Tax=Hibiscus sabdariffa TaxID=183260 RepID=A0ABR2DIR8_9ROSI
MNNNTTHSNDGEHNDEGESKRFLMVLDKQWGGRKRRCKASIEGLKSSATKNHSTDGQKGEVNGGFGLRDQGGVIDSGG